MIQRSQKLLPSTQLIEEEALVYVAVEAREMSSSCRNGGWFPRRCGADKPSEQHRRSASKSLKTMVDLLRVCGIHHGLLLD